MKKIATTLFIAILGGVFTLAGYTYFIEQPKLVNSPTSSKFQNAVIQQASYNTMNVADIETKDFSSIAENSIHAVVHVKNTAIKTLQSPFDQYFYGRSSVRQIPQIGTGSGVIISEDGYIITNNHVIANANEIEITLNDKKTYKATLVGTDTTNDIALLKIDAKNLPFIPFGNSDMIKVGEWVLAVGNPYNLTSTVTAGIVSAKGRDLDGNTNIDSFIQTDAAVNPGNSGGALVNTRGELIGINTAISSRTGSFIGYSFAVPSNIAKKVIEDIMEFGNVQKAILGVRGDELNSILSKELKIDLTEGFYVSAVVKNSGSEKAGIKAGDIIIGLDDVKINTFADLKGFLRSKGPNDTVEVAINRNGELEVLEVTLTKNDDKGTIETFGIELEPLSPKAKSNLQLDYGLRVNAITNKDLIQFGVKPGYVLLSINNHKIYSLEQAKTVVSQQASTKYFRLEMLNTQGQREYFTYR